jgi:hypothetical protein
MGRGSRCLTTCRTGTDVFIPIGAVKGVSKLKALKRANTLLTLEECLVSEEAQAVILKKSNKIAALREKLVADAIKKGKILVKNPNVKYHIMQKKHAWEKVISLTGDVEEDFKKVILFLEENHISDQKFFKKSFGFPEDAVVKKIIRSNYEAEIHGQLVQAVFENYVETGESFLKDAWIKTR